MVILLELSQRELTHYQANQKYCMIRCLTSNLVDLFPLVKQPIGSRSPPITN